MTVKLTGEEILDIKWESSDLGDEITIREWIMRVLETLIHEEEGFSGKRPFGNSGWICDLAKGLVIGKAISGKITHYEEDDYVEIDVDGYSMKDVKSAMYEAIAAL